MGCPRPPFASFLRLACRPRAPLEEPELVARRKELQSERLRLRPEIQELLVLGDSRELPGVLGEPAEPVVDLPKRRGVDALRGAGLLGRSCHLLHQAVHLSRRLAQRPPSREQLGQALRPPPDLIRSRLDGFRLLLVTLACRRDRTHQRADVFAEPRLAVLELAQHLRRAAQVLLGVEALALDPGRQRLVPAQLCIESFHGCGQPQHVRPVLGHGRCPYTAAPKGLQRDYPRFLRRLSWPRITPVFAPTAASRVRRISSVVEMPGTSGMRSTRPPRARVSSRPAISSSGQSAPFTRTSGPRAATSARGVSSSKTITWSTAARPASTSARSSAHRIGRPGPFSRRTEASPFSPTTSTSPSARAAARWRTWPGWRRSKQPFVKTL